MKIKQQLVPDNIIPIVVSTDENYARHLGVMAVSLLENTIQPNRCHFFIIDGGIHPSTHTTIKSEIEKRNGAVTFLKVDQTIYSSLPLRRGMTAAAYYRISIPELFDESVPKVIYLDCDLIVKGDISQLWDASLEGRHIGAVENISNSTYLASGLPQKKYFNSGVMVIDLKLWRQDKIGDKVREFKINYPEKTVTNDQCALNGVLYNSWTRLPLFWNQQSGLYRKSAQQDNFTPEELEAAIWEPRIIHYIGWSKPWIYLCFHPLAGEYDRYISLTAWADTRKKHVRTRDILRKHLSPSLIKKRLRQKRWQKLYEKRGMHLFNN